MDTPSPPSTGAGYFCPVDTEVRASAPGPCPRCGLQLEPEFLRAGLQTRWVCPMHAEIVLDAPGACPLCGLALEPRTFSVAERRNPELDDMQRRFVWSAAVTAPLILIALGAAHAPALRELLPAHLLQWGELLLASPVVLWGGLPFFLRARDSVRNRSLNMFSLIALGTGISYFYSVAAVAFPDSFPRSLHAAQGGVPVYFEAAMVITVLVQLGQVLELRARAQTGRALRLLLGLAPKTARLVIDGADRELPLEAVRVKDLLRVTPGE